MPRRSITGFAADVLSALSPFTTTTPPAPATGIALFDRFRGRHLLAYVGPAGQDVTLQPNFFSNKISIAIAQVSVGGLSNAMGLGTTAYGTATGLGISAGTFYGGREKTRSTSAATAQAICGFRTSAARTYFSTIANDGGFFVVLRFALGITAATNKVFVGMSTTQVMTLTAEPSALLNLFGVAADSAQTTFRFINNDGIGAATSVDLGASFPVTPAATNFYELALFSPSGGGQTVSYSFRRLNDGATATGTVTTDLPANVTVMTPQIISGNGATAAAVALDAQLIYVETDN